jgi:hypothetical protein
MMLFLAPGIRSGEHGTRLHLDAAHTGRHTGERNIG